jgi:hypothetical protein
VEAAAAEAAVVAAVAAAVAAGDIISNLKFEIF